MSIDGLSLAASRAAAAKAQKRYRCVLALDRGLRAAAALAALLAPGFLLGLLGIEVGPTAWVRAWGGLLLVVTALLLAGWFLPVRVRGANAIGIGGRGVLALVYLLLGGGFLWLALAEAAAAALLFWLYFRLFVREIMTRP